MAIVYYHHQQQEDIDKLEKFNKNFQWFREHYNDLYTKYKGEYVAINNSEVIDHDVDYERLIINRLKQRFAADTIRVFFIGKIYGWRIIMMTDTKKIVGDIGIGGLGYINAIVISRYSRIYSPTRFCVDTGCSVTIISHLDALRIGLDYSNNKSLQKSDQQTINGVRAFTPYILCGAEILFNSEGTSISEYVGNIHVMPPPPTTIIGANESNQISLLGVDVLKKFTISFSQNNIVLGK